ncbi:aminotransferase class I/II-fold pyridoxal phosphate-dependent enzyme, partial [Thermoleptolyngbya sp. M55_K2018_002]|uniref:aminotransferase class I/II-fold pyridoxal phosphate-dependent enzyme n=1 Tax=Thermoleptolyngbya sp. M55_K2018_002 TaxID=2747808 RepID=UPI0019E2E0A6
RPYFVNRRPEGGHAWDEVPDSVWADTQMLIVCSPDNPTGDITPNATWQRLFELADRHGFVIVADECYSEIYFDESAPPKGALQVAHELGRGDFRNLAGPLRDYTVDPTDPPNPNITSAVHIHRGEPTANGPFQYALTVTMRGDRDGRFAGEYTLTPEQRQALESGNLYLDIHTTRNRAGELRGVLRPY